MQEQLPELLQVCKIGLGDQESRVQRVTLRLLSAVIGLENTLPEPMSLLDIMPALFLVGAATISWRSLISQITSMTFLAPAIHFSHWAAETLHPTELCPDVLCRDYNHLKVSKACEADWPDRLLPFYRLNTTRLNASSTQVKCSFAFFNLYCKCTRFLYMLLSFGQLTGIW